MMFSDLVTHAKNRLDKRLRYNRLVARNRGPDQSRPRRHGRRPRRHAAPSLSRRLRQIIARQKSDILPGESQAPRVRLFGDSLGIEGRCVSLNPDPDSPGSLPALINILDHVRQPARRLDQFSAARGPGSAMRRALPASSSMTGMGRLPIFNPDDEASARRRRWRG